MYPAVKKLINIVLIYTRPKGNPYFSKLAIIPQTTQDNVNDTTGQMTYG